MQTIHYLSPFLLITVKETRIHNTHVLNGEPIGKIIVVQNYLYLLFAAIPENSLIFLATNA
jgi:hypothetical protein